MNKRNPVHFLFFQLPCCIAFFVFLCMFFIDASIFYSKTAYWIYDTRLLFRSMLSAVYLVVIPVVLKEMNK